MEYKLYFKIQMKMLIFLMLTSLAYSNTFTRSTCTSTQIFDTTTLECEECPTNMRPNPGQSIPTSCICNKGYYPDSEKSCQPLGATCPDNNFYNAITVEGKYTQPTPSSLTCTACANNAYTDINGTGCIPCPRNMYYNPSKGCDCINSGEQVTPLGCFSSSQLSSSASFRLSSSTYYEHLKYLLPSCAYFSDILSCSFLVNLCTYSMSYGLANAPQCQFFAQTSSVTSFHQLDLNSNTFYMAPGSYYKNQQLNFKILKYLPTGNFVQQKVMKLPDIFRCGVPYNSSTTIQIGNNIQTICSFDFNYLVQKIGTKTYENYLYEVLIQGSDKNFYQVAIYIGSNKTPVRRFFLEDTFTSSTYINVLINMKFTLSLNSSGYVVSPSLYVSYTKLSIQNGAVTPSSASTQSITYQIKFVYSLSSFWPPFIGIFITINVLVLIQSLARTYIAYLNRQSFLGFFYYLANFWSLWMFYFLIAISGYWFLFCKTTQGVYIFIPDADSDFFYAAFYIIAGLMGFFRLATVLYDKKQKLNYEVFMINWEKGKNSWREIFIINSLAEFYTHRTISFFWMLLCLMFFLVGLGWQSHAAEVMHTNLSSIYYFNPWNRVFLYFLGASIFLIIGIIFKILRRISVFQWPYPFQDFVDYCNVTNISFFFMKKRSPQAYYLHASIPDRSEVTYKQINDAIRRGLSKNRNIMKQHSFHQGQRIYSVYVCRELQQRFNNMIKKSEEEQQEKLSKHTKYKDEKKKNKAYVNPRQQFTQKKLKPYLDAIGREGSHRTKTLYNRLFGIPEINIRDPNNLKTNYVIFDDNLDIVSDVFPNGNEFQQIHTIIIIFLMFLLMTSNVCAAALLAYFVDYYMIDKWVSNTCRHNLERMTKVKQGFML